MTSGNAEQMPDWPSAEHVPAEELARRQGVRPIKSWTSSPDQTSSSRTRNWTSS
jgi:hypothetical protein